MQRRRLRTAAAAFLLATGGLGIGAAHADDNVSQACAAAGNAGTTHGGCVAAATATSHHCCRTCAQQDGLQQATATTNRGQCLKVLKSFVPCRPLVLPSRRPRSAGAGGGGNQQGHR